MTTGTDSGPFTDDDLWPPGEDAGRHRLDASRLFEPLKTLPLRSPVKATVGTRLDVVIRRLREAEVGGCLVEDPSGRLVGIFTVMDLLRKMPLEGFSPAEAAVESFMEPDPETLTPDHPIAYALNRMTVSGYRHIPLVDGHGHAVGLVTLKDIVQDLSETFSDEVLCLPPRRRHAIAREREGA